VLLNVTPVVFGITLKREDEPDCTNAIIVLSTPAYKGGSILNVRVPALVDDRVVIPKPRIVVPVDVTA
jgi:hypothetical protein